MSIVLEEGGVAAIKEWVKEEGVRLYVGVDVGATNARVALGRGTGQFVQVCKFQAAHTRTLLAGLEAVSELVRAIDGVGESTMGAGCLAAAGRIMPGGSEAEITNYEGTPQEQTIRIDQLPKFLFPAGRFLNDLEAACYGIAWLNQNRQLGEYFNPFLPEPSEATEPDSVVLKPHHYLVQAVGTGLGVGLMMHFHGSDSFRVLPLEGGHVLLNTHGVDDPAFEEEASLLAYLGRRLYDGKFTLEYEDLVSGRGLFYLYEWIRHNDNAAPELSDAGEVAANAKKDDPCPYARKALLYHYKYLARNSQNLAIALNARGVFWAGDNHVSNRAFVHKVRGELYEEFLNHPKREWLVDVPVYEQKKSFAVNLAGAIYIAQMDGKA